MTQYVQGKNNYWMSLVDGSGPYVLSPGGVYALEGIQGSTITASGPGFFLQNDGFWYNLADSSGPYVRLSATTYAMANTSGSLSYNPTTGVISAGGVQILLPQVIFSGGVPTVMPSSGTITNGVLSGITALANAYGNCWMYFPAGASLPSGAGWYFVQMGSTSGGQIYTAFNAAGSQFSTATWLPTIPTSLVPITSGGSAYTQTTSVIYGPSIPAPAKVLGKNGTLQSVIRCSMANTAGVKTFQGFASGGAYLWDNTPSAVSAADGMYMMTNRGVYNHQNYGQPYGFQPIGDSSMAYQSDYALVDTSVQWYIQLTIGIAVATDWAAYDAVMFTANPFP